MTDRPRTRAEERIAELDSSPAALAEQLEQLREQLLAAERDAEENRTGWQRAVADFANYRRRTEQDRLANLGLASEALLVKLLALADDFDRAITQLPEQLQGEPWVEGVTVIDRKLRAILDSEGLTPIPAEGQPFDPQVHEAVAQDPTDRVPDGTITTEFQRGYMLRDRVLRPALVAVAKAPTTSHSDSSNEEPADAGSTED
jgi:molecular chaperone GrpE